MQNYQTGEADLPQLTATNAAPVQALHKGAPSLRKQFNRKNPIPSAAMSDSDGLHYRCDWIEDAITVHSDGNVSCGLDDPHGQRSFGNVHSHSIEEILDNPEFSNLQAKLWNGHRCVGCGHYRQVNDADARSKSQRKLPSALVIEPTVICNIRCTNPPCLANNDPHAITRDADSLSLQSFKNIVDQLENSRKTVHFYNYGEPFMNRRAEEMLFYLRQKCNEALIVTSTNGIPLAKKSRAERVVQAAPSRVTFTISGVTQDVYSRYHVNGQLSAALDGLKNLSDAKRESGQSLPLIIWRYLVFHWNDSDEEIERAVDLAKEYGVDQLSLYLTDTPPGARSVRFSPGTPSYFKFLKYIHFDHLGRLDHAYCTMLPDLGGLHGLEDVPTLGWAYRTSSEAIFRYNGNGQRIRLGVSTDRLLSRYNRHTCSLRTPWSSDVIPLIFGRWTVISVDVPPDFRGTPFEVKLVAHDYWFSRENKPDDVDPRCFGVLVRTEGLLRCMLRQSLPTWTKKLARRLLASLGLKATSTCEGGPAVLAGGLTLFRRGV